MRHASAKASLPGAARQGNLQLRLRWVWLSGGEKGAAVAETGSMVENLKGRVRSFFRAQYCLVTAATATGLTKARSILLHRDLDGQMYG